MNGKSGLRELNDEESQYVNGGLSIPNAIGGIYIGWQIGWSTGMAINSYNNSRGTSLGEAIYYLTN